MALYGLDPTNDNAHDRGIRWHGAWYVKPGWVANSHGCVCPPNSVNDKVVKTLAHGSFVFTYFGRRVAGRLIDRQAFAGARIAKHCGPDREAAATPVKS